jgi:transcriptional regulator with XRE-family HTH domain
MSPKLGSYLRTIRLKSGLTQKDVAALLGLETGSAISRTEKGNGIPSLAILLGYCIIFEIHPKDIVPRMYQDIEKDVYAQAHVLVAHLEKRHATSALSERLKFLKELSQSGDISSTAYAKR